METQQSAGFFALFLENLQLLCRSRLNFDQVVEVSGYVCLELDNCRKERYFLSELIQMSGSVASASCCTQVLNKSHTVPVPASCVDQSSAQSSDSRAHLSHEDAIRDPELEMSEGQTLVNASGNSQVVENTYANSSVREIGLRFKIADVPESLKRQTTGIADTERRRGEEMPSSDFSLGDVDVHLVKREIEDEVKNKHDHSSSPSTYFHHNSEEVQQLKERIQAISNAKMAVPWLGTPLIHSIRSSNERQEIPSQTSHFKGQSAPMVCVPSASASISMSNSFPMNILGSEILQTFQPSSTVPSSSNMNSSIFIQNGSHAIASDYMNNADVKFGADMSHLGSNYKLHQVLNTPSRHSRKQKAPPSYRVRQNWRYAVRQFENFLRFKGLEVVPIHTIPPSRLDGMLCEFINWVKKNNGEEFHPWSVKNFFYHLEYHLKEFGYTSSITKGDEFKNSRDALRQKVNDLETKLHEASQLL